MPQIMLDDFLAYVEAENLFSPRYDKLLLALSGGVDSMVLAQILLEAGIQFGLAHCNFKLRGEESEEDAQFVRHFAQTHGLAFYYTSFETETLARQSQKSLQMMARELRYQWLEEIRQEHHYQYIVTAHHLSDSIETALMNLVKGCGIRGLHGILPKQSTIIRPLLFAHKEEIKAYALEHDLAYREDSSNRSQYYLRNQIRHQIIPLLQGLNPSLEHTFEENFQKWQDAEKMYQFGIDYFRRQVCRWVQEHQMSIDVMALRQSPAPRALLYEILAPYGFSSGQIPQIWLAATVGGSGALFVSDTHRLLRDRKHFLLQKKEDSKFDQVYYLEGLREVEDLETPFGRFRWQIYEREAGVDLPKFERDRNRAYFDLDCLTLPLRLRTWRQGDAFQPLGLRGRRRKVSDFFNDFKVSRFDKEAWPILESEGQIIWLVGFRSDERFKVREQTRQILALEFYQV